MARLRKKECWLAYGAALAAGMSLTKAAAHCGVHLTTSFRWRHRFLRAPTATREALGGVVEADETFFRRSHKGSRRWRRAAGSLERRPRRRGERAGKRGLSAEQVPALIARDRAGHTVDAVLPDLGAEAIGAALAPVVAGDAVLCSDGAKAYAAFAAEHGLRHEPINIAAGVRVRDGAFHIQNVNAYHGRLKGWMGRFNGVATRYLPELSRLATNPRAGARAKRLENLALRCRTADLNSQRELSLQYHLRLRIWQSSVSSTLAVQAAWQSA